MLRLYISATLTALIIPSSVGLMMSFQNPVGIATGTTEFPTFTFSDTWSALGPFQIGTREAAWGADPLELFGGFRNLEYSASETFRSSLAQNGTVSWSNHTAKVADASPRRAAAHLNVEFPGTPWQDLQNIYGWAALQWQAWVRGEIIVQAENTEILAFFASPILEFHIDGTQYFGGDFYGFKRAPVTLRLGLGVHRIDLRLVRDVRSSGGVGEPHLEVDLVLQKTFSALQPILNPSLGPLLSDLIGDDNNATLASPYGSIIVRNDAEDDITVFAVKGPHDACIARLLSEVRLVPGQSRPVAFALSCVPAALSSVKLNFSYRMQEENKDRSLEVTGYPQRRKTHESHKVTFLSPAGIVSYAILRPPSAKAASAAYTSATLPVFLGLHGAGVEADSDDIRHVLNPLPDLPAWALFPTGGTSWCGDDWHAWGFSDVEAAVAMIPDWIERQRWQGPRVELDRWLVSGHSNGGQGTWYALLHRPDKVIAASPLSGYSSIQNYVPYTFWHPAHPARTAIVQSALSTYKHELLLPNANGIPVFQQHGSADDNVPAYHSRLMAQLIREAGAVSQYVEFTGMPHYWDGAYTTERLRDFYETQIARNATKEPVKIRDLSFVTANPGDTGTKFGLKIIELSVPGQLGSVEVQFDPLSQACALWTINIRTLRLPPHFHECAFLTLDNQEIFISTKDEHHIIELIDGKWRNPSTSAAIPAIPRRHSRQLGSIEAVLRTHGTFQIVSLSKPASPIALQISRNLCQYFAADSNITSSYEDALQASGNIILLSTGQGTHLPRSFYHSFPISVVDGKVLITRPHTSTVEFTSQKAGQGLAAIFLRPLALGRSELVIWGIDEQSLAVAARLVPMMTGTGQPDFVVMDKRMLAKGLDGALALGFLDHEWGISTNSFFATK